MKELMVFENTEVEVFELDGKVLFNPRHVGACLGMSYSAVRDHMQTMSDKQLIVLRNSNVGLTDIRKLANRGENFLTESGVYKLIFKSRKPQAEKFMDWVADEVLPAIRKTGRYEHPEVKTEVKSDSLIALTKDFDAAERAADLIAMDEKTRLWMAHNIYLKHGFATDVLPSLRGYPKALRGKAKAQAKVKKTKAAAYSEAYAASRLIKANGYKQPTARFNQAMINAGYMRVNPSTYKKELIGAGLNYGTNVNNVAFYYASTFEDLFKKVMRKVPHGLRKAAAKAKTEDKIETETQAESYAGFFTDFDHRNNF